MKTILALAALLTGCAGLEERCRWDVDCGRGLVCRYAGVGADPCAPGMPDTECTRLRRGAKVCALPDRGPMPRP